jgi:hypothetical protein
VLAGMVVLAAMGILLLLQLGEDDAKSSPRAVRLLRDIVSDEAKRCKEVDPVPRSIAALSCDLGAPMESLRVSLFTSSHDLRQAMLQRVRSSGIVEGDCSTQRLAWDDWSLGKVICDYGDRDVEAKLEWSRHDTQVLLEAVARPGADAYAVYKWWAGESNGQPTNNSLPYPNRFEEYVLERAGLKQSACERASTYNDSVASLRCDTGPDELGLYYYFTRKKLERAFVGSPGPGGSCTSDRATPGRQRYSVGGRQAGVRLCYGNDSEQTSTVEWINWSSRIYGFVEVDEYGISAIDDLYGWWERRGRYLTD